MKHKALLGLPLLLSAFGGQVGAADDAAQTAAPAAEGRVKLGEITVKGEAMREADRAFSK